MRRGAELSSFQRFFFLKIPVLNGNVWKKSRGEAALFKKSRENLIMAQNLTSLEKKVLEQNNSQIRGLTEGERLIFRFLFGFCKGDNGREKK